MDLALITATSQTPSPLRGGLGRGGGAMIARAPFKGGNNDSVDSLRPFEDVGIRKSKHVETAAGQVVIPGFVIEPGGWIVVAKSVDLNDKTRMKTGEINIIRPQLDLLAKVPAVDAKRLD